MQRSCEVSAFQRFMSEYSIIALMVVVGLLLIVTGIVMWGGWPAFLICLGIIILVLALLSA